MPPRGDYQTERKDAVEAYFKQHADQCLTAEECCRYLSDHGMAIGKTTIYRAVTKLCDAGRLRRYMPSEQGKAALYQFNACKEHHLHMVCRMCGALEHLHCDDAEHFCSHLLKEHRFVLDESQTVLYGYCAACAEKQMQKKEGCAL